MANEAVILTLLGDEGDVVRYTCADAPAITKGTLLWFSDPMTISGASTNGMIRAGAGVAAHDKTASDGSTSIGVYTKGIFDLTAVAAPPITAGNPVVISGQNTVAAATAANYVSGAVIGKALEDSSASEVIAVLLEA